LASVEEDLGNYQKAKELLEEALRIILEKNLKKYNILVEKILNNLDKAE